MISHPSFSPPPPSRPAASPHQLDPHPNLSRAPCGAAFTLVELLVAASITTVMLLGMAGVFDQSMKAWRISNRRSDAEREVRAALKVIQADFSNLYVSSALPIYRMTTTAAFATPSRTPDYNGSVATFFLTSASLVGQPPNAGDLCGVGYYVAWDTATRTYNLYRYFQNGLNQGTAITTFVETTGSINSKTGLFPASLTTPQGDELIGANVVNFRVEFKTLPTAFGPVTSQDGPVITSSPGYVQLELTAYGAEAVRRFNNQAEWYASTNIQRFGRTYLWRINL